MEECEELDGTVMVNMINWLGQVMETCLFYFTGWNTYLDTIYGHSKSKVDKQGVKIV